MTRRPPAFPPSGPRQRPKEVEAELERLSQADDGIPAKSGGVSTRLRERLEERNTAKRRARRTRMGIIGGALALAAALTWTVMASPLLALKLDNLDVTGTTSYVSAEEVHSTLAAYEGVPLARLNTGDIRDRLRENYAIKDARFVRVWPTGLSIAIEARTPVAATPSEDGFVVLDGEGAELGTSAEEIEGLPLMTLGEDIEDLPGTISAVLEVMDALPPQVLEQVDTAGAQTPDNVEFVLASGARVVWGSAEDSELKSSVLEVLLDIPAEVYNVASPMHPITS